MQVSCFRCLWKLTPFCACSVVSLIISTLLVGSSLSRLDAQVTDERAKASGLDAQSNVPHVSQIFEANCAGCHGTDMSGGIGPSLVDKVWIHGNDDVTLSRVIAEGAVAKGMPSFGKTLSISEQRALLAYIREKGSDESIEVNLPTQPLPAGVQKSEHEVYRLERVATGLVTPWSIVFLSRDKMLVSERPGRLRVVGTDGKVGAPIAGLPVIRNEFVNGGMLDLALHPDFAHNGWIYASFTDERPDVQVVNICKGRTLCQNTPTQIKVFRFRLRNNHAVDRQDIWQSPLADYRYSINFGGRLVFDKKSNLYIAVGDRFYTPLEAQDLALPSGKIIRIRDDGGMAADNPFGAVKGSFPSIFTAGHRNVQGLAVDPRTGLVWATEHGPRGGDELNLIRAGGNYGWPIATYGMGYDGRPFNPDFALGHSQQAVPQPNPKLPADTTSLQEPLLHWTPSIAISAIAFYTGKAFPKWNGNLFVTSLREQQLIRVVVEGDRVIGREDMFKHFGRLRAIAESPDGALYLATNEPDAIIRVVPAKPFTRP